jgi:hypothetical protein
MTSVADADCNDVSRSLHLSQGFIGIILTASNKPKPSSYGYSCINTDCMHRGLDDYFISRFRTRRNEMHEISPLFAELHV